MANAQESGWHAVAQNPVGIVAAGLLHRQIMPMASICTGVRPVGNLPDPWFTLSLRVRHRRLDGQCRTLVGLVRLTQAGSATRIIVRDDSVPAPTSPRTSPAIAIPLPVRQPLRSVDLS